MRTVVWFRQDLRIQDNPALALAAKEGEVVPVYIWAPKEEGDWAPGESTRAWLHHSLGALNRSLEGSLILQLGPTLSALEKVLKQSKAERLFFNRRYEPAALALEQKIRSYFREKGVDVQTFNSSLLVEPWGLETQARKPYQVFTPFWKTALKVAEVEPIQTPPIKLEISGVESLKLDTLPFPKEPLSYWEAGEMGALNRLEAFIKEGLSEYSAMRDRPDLDGVSRLSPYLHFGEIGPRQIIKKIASYPAADPFIRQLYWREFAYHLLYHFPKTPHAPLRSQFENFPWASDQAALKAWQEGRTGYPIVDAGMRQLRVMGWMHNRVRMIVASFLTKDLLIPWQEGAKWFWQWLFDADLANNTLGWQWTAGCGADAAPYFRIFNPVSQGKKFDPEGNYIRCFVPELQDVPTKWIHAPWESPDQIVDYPGPIIDHAKAREEALRLFENL